MLYIACSVFKLLCFETMDSGTQWEELTYLSHNVKRDVDINCRQEHTTHSNTQKSRVNECNLCQGLAISVKGFWQGHGGKPYVR